MSDKLPERPEKPSPHAHMVEHCQYWMGMSDYYRARMEALVEVVRDLRRVGRGERDYEVELDREVDELLAACERRKS